MPTVSVILPTCDRPGLWPRALGSVLRQTWRDLEVLLVDSNRRERPLRENAALRERVADPRVVLVTRAHGPSAAAARNAGLEAAKGDWVTYLDDDDVYHPEKIAAQLELARARDASIVLCGYTVVMPRRQRSRQIALTEFHGDELLTEANWGTPMLFHRRDLRAHFDETLRAGGDEVFAHSFLQRAGETRVPNCPRSLVNVFPQIGAGRVHRSENLWRAYQANWRNIHTRYSRRAWRQYLAKGLLVRAQGGYGSTAHFARCVRMVAATHGGAGWRLIANASAHRFGVLSKWVVS